MGRLADLTYQSNERTLGGFDGDQKIASVVVTGRLGRCRRGICEFDQAEQT